MVIATCPLKVSNAMMICSVCPNEILFLYVCITQTKEEMVGTVESVQALQAQSGHLQKSKEGYHAKCLELDRLRKEGAPQKELEKVGHHSFKRWAVKFWVLFFEMHLIFSFHLYFWIQKSKLLCMILHKLNSVP